MSDQTQATASAPAASAADDRYKMIKDPDTGQPVKRKDYIVDQFVNKKKSRGDIARALTKIVQAENPSAKAIPYQTVFAVTKKLQGGPPKEAPAAGNTGVTGVSSETPASA
jgi:hypothetical protein